VMAKHLYRVRYAGSYLEDKQCESCKKEFNRTSLVMTFKVSF
jgi:hypothetical protein